MVTWSVMAAMALAGLEEAPSVGLIIRQPWSALIVDGFKSWELRGSCCKKREKIGILDSGCIIGEVRLVGCVKIAEMQEDGSYRSLLPRPLDYYEDCHRVSDFSMFKYKSIFAWILSQPRRYIQSKKIHQKRGAMVWVKIPTQDQDSQDAPAPAATSSSSSRAKAVPSSSGKAKGKLGRGPVKKKGKRD